MAKRDIPEVNAGSMADIAFLLLIFFLVTTTMDKDQAYIRNIPKKIELVDDPVIVEERNIFAIQANSQNQLMVRGSLMNDPDEISERIIEFYRENEKSNNVKNDFPMYSRISMPEINALINKTTTEAEEVENTPNALPDIIDFKWRQVAEWEKKKTALEMLETDKLAEISVQAHIRIEVQKATEYELFAKIQSEVEQAISELRDDAAMKIFNESYKSIKNRLAMDKGVEDREKIQLLKILYPARIIEVTPKR
ncbi:MAG: biopolymer transporter ExbD [Fluviicola sp.]|nr:biopolymer transporter ExbD [Fluviicola sp.]